jgi:hypothetical protein
VLWLAGNYHDPKRAVSLAMTARVHGNDDAPDRVQITGAEAASISRMAFSAEGRRVLAHIREDGNGSQSI